MVNPTEYVKNVGKSLGYVALKKFKADNPTIAAMIDTNKDTVKDIYETVKDWKEDENRASLKDKVLQSEYPKIGINFVKNTLDDLKTGKFYNEEREAEMSRRMAKGMGFDLDFDDSDFSFDDSDLDMEFNMEDGFDDLEMTVDHTGGKISKAISEVTVKSADYMVDSQKYMTGKILEQQEKSLHEIMKGFSSVNASLANIDKIGETITTHSQNSSVFFTSSTEYQNKVLQSLSNIENAIVVKKKKANSKEEIHVDDVLGMEGDIDILKFYENIKNNVKEELSLFTDLFGMTKGEDGEGVNTLEAMTASPVAIMMKAMLNALTPKAATDLSTKINENLKGLMGTAIMQLNNKSRSFTGKWTDKIWEMMGIRNDLYTNYDTGKYEKGRVEFDGMTRKAITEVIPVYLSKILSALNGQIESRYNYKTGKFIKTTSIEKSKWNMIANASKSAGWDLKDAFEEYTEGMEDQKELLKKLDTFFVESVKSARAFNYRNADSHTFKEFGLDDRTGQILVDFYNDLRERGKDSIYLNFNNEILQARQDLTNRFRNLERNGDDVLAHLHNNSMDTHNDRGDIVKGVFGDTKSSVFNLNNMYDNKHNNVFYYLQGILQHVRHLSENIHNFSNYDDDYYDENTSPISPSPNGPVSYSRARRRVRRMMRSNNADDAAAAGGYIPIRDIEDNTPVPESTNTNTTRETNGDRFKDRNAYINYLGNLWTEPDEYSDVESERNPSNEYKFSNITKGRIKLVDYDEYLEMEDAQKRKYLSRVQEAKEDKRNRRDDGRLIKFLPKFMQPKEGTQFEKLVISVNKAISKPFEAISRYADTVTHSLTDFMYGNTNTDGKSDEEIANEQEARDRGFIPYLFYKLKHSFKDFGNWMHNTILDPIADSLNIHSAGDVADKILNIFGIDRFHLKDEAHRFFEEFKESFLGVKQEDGKYTNGFLSQFINEVKDNFKGVTKFSISAYKDVFGGMYRWLKGELPDEEEDSSSSNTSTSNTNTNPTSKRSRKKDRKGKRLKRRESRAARAAEEAVQNARHDEATGNTNTASDIDVDNIDTEGINIPTMNSSILDSILGGVNEDEEPQAATGGQVTKTGLVAVSKGEMIIPSEDNPFYHGPTNKDRQRKAEARAIDNFYGSFYNGNIKGVGVVEPTKEESKARKELNKVLRKYYGKDYTYDRFKADFLRDNADNPDAIDKFNAIANNPKALSNLIRQSVSKTVGKARADKRKAKGKKYGIKEFFHNIKKDYDGEDEPSVVKQSVDKLTGGIKQFTDALLDTDDEDFNKLRDNVKKVSKEAIKEFKTPKGAGGAITGALLGVGTSILTGGIVSPLLAAAIGAGAGLVTKSNSVSEILFGKMTEDGTHDASGIFSAEIGDFITTKLPSIAKTGFVGSTLSLLPFIPGGPITGLFVGSAIGFVKDSEDFKDKIFGPVGENGKRMGGTISKDVQEQIKKAAPNMGAGMIASALALPVGGLATRLIVGATLGYASTTEDFQNYIFGEMGEDGKRHGGITGYLRDKVVLPLFDGTKNIAENILARIEDTFSFVKHNIVDSLRDVLWVPIKKKMQSALFTPITAMAKAAMHVFSRGLSLPASIIQNIGNHAKKNTLLRGRLTSMSAGDRMDWRENEMPSITNNTLTRTINNSKLGQAFSNTGFAKFMDNRINGINNSRLGQSVSHSRFGRFWDRHMPSNTIRPDKWRGVDEHLQYMDNDQIDELLDMAHLLQDRDKGTRRNSKIVMRNVGDYLGNYKQFGWRQTKYIQEALERGDIDAAIRLVDNVANRKKMSDEDRQSIVDNITTNGRKLAKFRELVQDKDYLEGQVQTLFKDKFGTEIKSGKDLDRLIGLLKAEKRFNYAEKDEEEKEGNTNNHILEDTTNKQVVNDVHEILQYIRILDGVDPSSLTPEDKKAYDKARSRINPRLLERQENRRAAVEEGIQVANDAWDEQHHVDNHTLDRGLGRINNSNIDSLLGQVNGDEDKHQAADGGIVTSGGAIALSRGELVINPFENIKNKIEYTTTLLGENIKQIRNNEGELVPDLSDNGSREARKHMQEYLEAQTQTPKILGTLSIGFNSLMDRLFKGTKDKEKSSLLSALFGEDGLVSWASKKGGLIGAATRFFTGAGLIGVIGTAVKGLVTVSALKELLGLDTNYGNGSNSTVLDTVTNKALSKVSKGGNNPESSEHNYFGTTNEYTTVDSNGNVRNVKTNKWGTPLRDDNGNLIDNSTNESIDGTKYNTVDNSTSGTNSSQALIGNAIRKGTRGIETGGVKAVKKLSKYGLKQIGRLPLIKQAKNGVSNIASSIKDARNLGKDLVTSTSSATYEATQEAIDSITTSGSKVKNWVSSKLVNSGARQGIQSNKEYIISEILADTEKALSKVFSKIPRKWCNNPDEAVQRFITRIEHGLTEAVPNKLASIKTGVKEASKAIQLFFIVDDFNTGIQDAASMLGVVDEVSTGEKLLCGFIRVIKNNLFDLLNIFAKSGILVVSSVTFGFIPDQWLVDLVIDVLGPAFGVDFYDIQRRRQEAKDTVDKYNTSENKKYNIEDYNKQVLGRKNSHDYAKEFISDIKNNAGTVHNRNKKKYGTLGGLAMDMNSANKAVWNHLSNQMGSLSTTDLYLDYWNKATGDNYTTDDARSAWKDLPSTISSKFGNLIGRTKLGKKYNIGSNNQHNTRMEELQNKQKTITNTRKKEGKMLLDGSETFSDYFKRLKNEGRTIPDDYIDTFITYIQNNGMDTDIIPDHVLSDIGKSKLGRSNSAISKYTDNIANAHRNESGKKANKATIAQANNTKEYDKKVQELKTAVKNGDVKKVRELKLELNNLDPTSSLTNSYFLSLKNASLPTALLNSTSNSINEINAKNKSNNTPTANYALKNPYQNTTTNTTTTNTGFKGFFDNGNPSNVANYSSSNTTTNYALKNPNTVTTSTTSTGSTFLDNRNPLSVVSGKGTSSPNTTKFISQASSAVKDIKYGSSNIGEEGCGPAVAAMAINQAKGNNVVNIKDTIAYARRNGYETNGGTSSDYFQDLFNSNGIDSNYIDTSREGLDEVDNNLKSGIPTVLLGRDENNKSKSKSPFGNGNHYVLANGYDKNGNIIILDPEQNKSTTYSPNILNSVSTAISTSKIGSGSNKKYNNRITNKARKATITKFPNRIGGGLRGSDLIEEGFNFFIDNGLSAAASAGIVGNIMAETDGGYKKIDISSIERGKPANRTGVGIVQWTGGRCTAFLEWSKSIGHEFPENTNYEVQLQYVLKELFGDGVACPWAFEKSYGSAYQQYNKSVQEFITMTDPAAAATVWCCMYERPNLSQAHMNWRQENAVEVYNKYSGNTPIEYDGTITGTNSTSSSSSTGLLDTLKREAQSVFYNSIDKDVAALLGISSGDDNTTSNASTSSSNITSTQSSELGSNIVSTAKQYIGTPYKMGGTDLEKAIDCSSFTQQVLSKNGITVPRTAAEQHDAINNVIDRDKAKAGDVVFFKNTYKSGISHVGIVTDDQNNFIHAGSHGVAINNLSEKYYNEHFDSIRRPAELGAGSGLFSNNIPDFSEGMPTLDLSKDIRNTNKSISKSKRSKSNMIGKLFGSSESSSGTTRIGGTTNTNTSDKKFDNLIYLVQSIMVLLTQEVGNSTKISTNTDNIKNIASLLSNYIKSQNKSTSKANTKKTTTKKGKGTEGKTTTDVADIASNLSGDVDENTKALITYLDNLASGM